MSKTEKTDQSSSFSKEDARSPLRILMTWRPESAGDETAQVAAWVARTDASVVRTATVIPRVWSEQPGAKDSEDYQKWLAGEIEGCARAAQHALASARLPKGALDSEQASIVKSDHSETKMLLDAAKDFDADVMVIGSHPAAPRERFRIGSTADALLHCSNIPVLLAPRAPKLSKRGITRVNCCYIDTDQSHEALRLSADLAMRWHVPLRLVAFSPRGAGMYPTQTTFSQDAAMMVEWREQALALLDRGRDRAVSRHPHLSVQTEAGSGYGWSGAINALKWKKGDLLVLGSSSLGEFNKVFIGPSTNQIVRHSPVPVLLSTV